jgi:hypothetical protein
MLYLNGTLITDKSVPDLCALKRLSFLDVSDTKISKEGQKKLAAELPNANLYGSDVNIAR